MIPQDDTNETVNIDEYGFTEKAHPLDILARKVHVANMKWWINIHTSEVIERNVGELLMLTVSELAEALEGDRKNLMDGKLPQYKMFDVEIVDTFIRLLDIAGAKIPNLGQIFSDKMAFNARREDHKIESRLKVDGKKY